MRPVSAVSAVSRGRPRLSWEFRERVTFSKCADVARQAQKNGCSEGEHPLQLFSLVGSRRLRSATVYFFFFFLAAFFFVAIERLLEILGPDSDPDHLSAAANQVTREYCGTEFALSTEKCILTYHDRQE